MLDKKAWAKQWIDANVWDGEDRAGATGDWAKFTPDELQELIDDMLNDMEEYNELEKIGLKL